MKKERKFSLGRIANGEVDLICNDYVILTITSGGFLRKMGSVSVKFTGLKLDSEERIVDIGLSDNWRNVVK